MEYYYRQRNHDYKILPPFKAGCISAENTKQMELIYPQPEAKIYVPVEINGEKGKTIFSAAHRNHKAKIFWSLDDSFIITTETTHQIAISPSPGKHIITLTDDQGNSISRGFEIIDKEKK
jgi:penicillin-binding protein 1C